MNRLREMGYVQTRIIKLFIRIIFNLFIPFSPKYIIFIQQRKDRQQQPQHQNTKTEHQNGTTKIFKNYFIYFYFQHYLLFILYTLLRCSPDTHYTPWEEFSLGEMRAILGRWNGKNNLTKKGRREIKSKWKQKMLKHSFHSVNKTYQIQNPNPKPPCRHISLIYSIKTN